MVNAWINTFKPRPKRRMGRHVRFYFSRLEYIIFIIILNITKSHNFFSINKYKYYERIEALGHIIQLYISIWKIYFLWKLFSFSSFFFVSVLDNPYTSSFIKEASLHIAHEEFLYGLYNSVGFSIILIFNLSRFLIMLKLWNPYLNFTPYTGPCFQNNIPIELANKFMNKQFT